MTPVSGEGMITLTGTDGDCWWPVGDLLVTQGSAGDSVSQIGFRWQFIRWLWVSDELWFRVQAEALMVVALFSFSLSLSLSHSKPSFIPASTEIEGIRSCGPSRDVVIVQRSWSLRGSASKVLTVTRDLHQRFQSSQEVNILSLIMTIRKDL